MGSARSGRPAPGDALLHPVVLAALCALVVNDHVLKASWPGPVTGKLSDVAGMILFPILLVSAWELGLATARRWGEPSRATLRIAIAATGGVFLSVKAVPALAVAAGWLFGVAQWSLGLPLWAVLGGPIPPVLPAVIVADPTDLLTLPCLAIAAWIGSSRLVTGTREAR